VLLLCGGLVSGNGQNFSDIMDKNLYIVKHFILHEKGDFKTARSFIFENIIFMNAGVKNTYSSFGKIR
jgi:hypothetical protein